MKESIFVRYFNRKFVRRNIRKIVGLYQMLFNTYQEFEFCSLLGFIIPVTVFISCVITIIILSKQAGAIHPITEAP